MGHVPWFSSWFLGIFWNDGALVEAHDVRRSSPASVFHGFPAMFGRSRLPFGECKVPALMKTSDFPLPCPPRAIEYMFFWDLLGTRTIVWSWMFLLVKLQTELLGVLVGVPRCQVSGGTWWDRLPFRITAESVDGSSNQGFEYVSEQMRSSINIYWKERFFFVRKT